MQLVKCVDYVSSGKYAYKLLKPQVCNTGINPPHSINHEYFFFTGDGTLTIKEGYAWDGATGAVDTPDFMRGSLFHDAILQMVDIGLLEKRYRKLADKLLYRLCREDGMPLTRACWVYSAVRLYGKTKGYN